MESKDTEIPPWQRKIIILRKFWVSNVLLQSLWVVALLYKQPLTFVKLKIFEDIFKATLNFIFWAKERL